MMNKLIYGLGGALLLVAAVLTAMGWTVIRVVDRVAIQDKAATYDALIKRDDFGVPHIFGVRDADVAFGLGYAQSEDDFDNVALSVAMGRGELAKFRGAAAGQTDYLVYLFRNLELIEERYETDLAPKTRALLEAYADGVNLYAMEHGEGEWRGTIPVSGKDIVAGFTFRLPFFFGFEQHLGKIFDPEGFSKSDEGEFNMPLENEEDVRASLLTGTSWPIGSNALAPGRSAEGATRLLINSHQPYAGPVAWYEVVLQSEEGWHMAGGVFPGAPVVGHGHNEHLGWANTVNHPDLTDVYSLTLNPDNDNEYLFDGEWRAFERGNAPIRVKLFGPISWTFNQETLYSVYGPAVKLDHGAFAVTHAGMGEIRQVEQMYRQNLATTLEEWTAALEMHAIPSFNYLYADKKGHIAMFYNARMPKRSPEYNWQGLVPGDTSKTLWNGYHGLKDLPHYIDPDAGFLINSNNSPFFSTAPSDNLLRSDYPVSFGIERRMTNRALRLLELFNDDPSISKDEFYAYKFDKRVVAGSRMMNLLTRLKTASLEDADLIKAQALIRSWDGDTGMGNPAAALSILTGLRILDQKPGDSDGDIAIMKGVAAELVAHHGQIDVAWGRINRIKRGDVNLPIGGGPQILRAVYGGSELDENGTLSAVAGDTFVMMVEWDKDGKVSSESIHQFGSATLDETSKHYADQVKLFAEEKFKPVWFYENDLEGHIERTYRPGRSVSEIVETGE
jgi:penicillin amidase/acyl-homoserine-lactone acylase